jgi:hypothetical protein
MSSLQSKNFKYTSQVVFHPCHTINPTNPQTNVLLPSLTQSSSCWPIITISSKLPDSVAIISDWAHIYPQSSESSSFKSDSANSVENPVVQSAKEKLASFSLQQEAAIWNTMLALCASKLNAGCQAENHPLQFGRKCYTSLGHYRTQVIETNWFNHSL